MTKLLNKIGLIIISLFAFSLFVGLSTTSYAEDTKTPSEIENYQFSVGKHLIVNEKQEKNFFGDEKSSPIVVTILNVIDFAIQIIGTIAVILIIVSGFMFMTAMGNQQRLENAKEVVKYAVIGLVITFLSYTIIISVQTIFNKAQ